MKVCEEVVLGQRRRGPLEGVHHKGRACVVGYTLRALRHYPFPLTRYALVKGARAAGRASAETSASSSSAQAAASESTTTTAAAAAPPSRPSCHLARARSWTAAASAWLRLLRVRVRRLDVAGPAMACPKRGRRRVLTCNPRRCRHKHSGSIADDEAIERGLSSWHCRNRANYH